MRQKNASTSPTRQPRVTGVSFSIDPTDPPDPIPSPGARLLLEVLAIQLLAILALGYHQLSVWGLPWYLSVTSPTPPAFAHISDQGRALVCSASGIRLYDLQERRQIRDLSELAMPGNWASISADGALIASAGWAAGDRGSAAELRTLPDGALLGRWPGAWDAHLSPDGRWLALGYDGPTEQGDTELRVIALPDLREHVRWPRHTERVDWSILGFTTDNRLILEYQRQILAIAPTDGQKTTLHQHDPDSEQAHGGVLVGNRWLHAGGFRLRDLVSGRELTWPPHFGTLYAASRDGRWLAASNVLVDTHRRGNLPTPTGDPGTLLDSRGVTGISTDGRYLVVQYGDHQRAEILERTPDGIRTHSRIVGRRVFPGSALSLPNWVLPAWLLAWCVALLRAETVAHNNAALGLSLCHQLLVLWLLVFAEVAPHLAIPALYASPAIVLLSLWLTRRRWPLLPLCRLLVFTQALMAALYTAYLSWLWA